MCHCGGKPRGGGEPIKDCALTKLSTIFIAGRHVLLKDTRDDAMSNTSNELNAIFLEEEIRELRNSLSTERSKNNRLMRLIEKKVLERQKSSRY